MSTKAMTGAGFTVTIGGTSIGQIQNAQFSGEKWSFADITNAGSPVPTGATGLVQMEKTPTVLDPSTCEINGIWLYNDAGQQALTTAAQSGALSTFVITLPKGEGQATAGATFTFSAYVAEVPIPQVAYDKPLTWKTSLQLNTTVTISYGS